MNKILPGSMTLLILILLACSPTTLQQLSHTAPIASTLALTSSLAMAWNGCSGMILLVSQLIRFNLC